jgi:hypothetical protein
MRISHLQSIYPPGVQTVVVHVKVPRLAFGKGQQMGFNFRSKWVLIFFFHVCDRPYRVITVGRVSSKAKAVGRVPTNSLTWLAFGVHVAIAWILPEP